MLRDDESVRALFNGAFLVRLALGALICAVLTVLSNGLPKWLSAGADRTYFADLDNVLGVSMAGTFFVSAFLTGLLTIGASSAMLAHDLRAGRVRCLSAARWRAAAPRLVLGCFNRQRHWRRGAQVGLVLLVAWAGAWNLGILIGCGVGGGSFSDALHARGVCSLSAEAWVGAACAWGQLTMWMVFTANYTFMADAALYE